MSSIVLMKDAASNCLVNLLNNNGIKLSSSGLVTRGYSGIELLDEGLELTLCHLIAKCLCTVNKNTLFCRLDICHFYLLIILKQLSYTAKKRLRGSTFSVFCQVTVFYSIIITQRFGKIKYFSKIILFF